MLRASGQEHALNTMSLCSTYTGATGQEHTIATRSTMSAGCHIVAAASVAGGRYVTFDARAKKNIGSHKQCANIGVNMRQACRKTRVVREMLRIRQYVTNSTPRMKWHTPRQPRINTNEIKYVKKE